MTKNKSDDNIKNNVLLTGASKKEVKKLVNNSKKILLDLDSQISKIGDTLSKADVQERFFVLDGIMGILFQSSNLPPYIISAICGKYSLIAQLPYTMQSKPEEEHRSSYIG